MQGSIVNGEVRTGRPRAHDIFAHMGPAVYRAAAEAGVNPSVYLETQDPSNEYRDGMDAFERVLAAGEVHTTSNPSAGIYASEMAVFDQSPQHRSLVPELIARIWRSASFGGSASTRALYTSAEDIPGSSLRPYGESGTIGVTGPVAPPFPLNSLIAMNTPISGSAYRKVYLDTTAASLRRRRVAEGDDIPLGKLTTSTHAINLYKYAGGIKATYESLRRTRLDKMRMWLAQEAVRNEIDKISSAVNTAVSGDGNASTAADAWRAKTDFDSTATAKSITLKAWTMFKLKFAPYFKLTHIIGAEADIAKLLLLNIGTSGMPVYMVDPTSAISTTGALADGTIYGISADVPTDKLVGIDSRQALEQVIEIGSNIDEIDRWAQSQVQILTLSEIMNWAILTQGATKTLELET